MGFKRKFKRFRYYCSWRYPRLFLLAQRLAFPVQVSALCIALYFTVTFYQQHFSFDATMRAHETRQASISEEPALLEFDTEIPVAAALDGPHINPSITVQVERQGNQKNNVISELKPQLENPLPTQPKLQQPAPPIDDLLNSEWLLKQNNESFVIQLAISSNEAELKKYALNLPIDGPLAMYPFKRTTDGKLTYGLSAGLYPSSVQAQSALATFPEGSGKYGSWIRQVSDISTQISVLNLEY